MEMAPMGPRSGSWTVIDFRIERTDDNGRPVALPRVAVEMRGPRFQGSLVEGDMVEVRGRVRRGHMLQVRSVRNLSSSSSMTVVGGRAPRTRRAVRALLITCVMAAFAVVALTIASQALSIAFARP
jgi:hypothetical protein